MIKNLAPKLVQLAPGIRNGEQAGLKADYLCDLSKSKVSKSEILTFVQRLKNTTLEDAVTFFREF